MNSFEIHIPTRIYFGNSKAGSFFDRLKDYGSRALIVIGGGSVKRTGYLDEVTDHLSSRNIDYVLFEGIEPNPHAATIDKAAAFGKENSVDFVLAFGGGSVMDASKAIAGLIHNDEKEIWPFVLGEPKYKTMKGALPVATIPTTAATASEVTAHAVISNPEVKGKSPISYPFLKPSASWLNPVYHTSLPLETTRDGASDILSHVFENYILGGNESPLADRYSEGVMQTVIEALPNVLEDPENEALRGQLLWASTMALNTMQTAGRVPTTFLLHNLEHALSGYNPNLAHGRGLAILYPAYFKWLVQNDRCVDRLALLGEKLFDIKTADINESAAEFIAVFELWLENNGLYQRLTDQDIPVESFDEIAEYALRVYGDSEKIDAAGPITKENIVEIFSLTEEQVTEKLSAEEI
ncbi:MAG: iron-containing alcohol dehydrogenase [Balneolaceae bacterium]|nr:iron-containing alcohol dehydrogenase [Balneolaceae bacterium]